MVTLLIVLLVLMMLGSVPTWPHSRSWGYYPSGGLEELTTARMAVVNHQSPPALLQIVERHQDPIAVELRVFEKRELAQVREPVRVHQSNGVPRQADAYDLPRKGIENDDVQHEPAGVAGVLRRSGRAMDHRIGAVANLDQRSLTRECLAALREFRVGRFA